MSSIPFLENEFWRRDVTIKVLIIANRFKEIRLFNSHKNVSRAFFTDYSYYFVA